MVEYSSQASSQIPPWNELTFAFTPGYDTHTVQFSYSGLINPEHGHGNEASESRIHLSIDSAWHPIFVGFSTTMQGEVNLALDNSWEVYSPGSINRDDKLITIATTSPQVDVALFATQSDKALKEQGFSVVHDDKDAEFAAEFLPVGSRCLTSLNEQFGKNSPLKSASLILLDRDGPSFARKNYLSVNSNNIESPLKGYQLICHEIAHNWIELGDVMSHDYWMSESFAELVAASEIKSQFGDAAYQQIVDVWHELAQGTEFVWREDVPQRASHRVNYGLGPLKLLQLKEKIGEDTFDQFVAEYMLSDIAKTGDLLDMLASLTKPDIATWFKKRLTTGQADK